MASSGAEVRWAGPGLGKGPRRRRWAWAEEKDAERSSVRGRGEEQHFSRSPSPELLEDFLAQQHLQPLQWSPDVEESGGSSGEVTEAEDADSPESSALPLTWLPQHDQQPDMTDEEPDEAPGSPEAEDEDDTESSPGLGCRAAPSWEGHENNSPVALGRGRASSPATSGQEASGNKLPGPFEVNPSADLGSVKSWSSGTVSLGHPVDSFESTWEGETDVPEPTARAETRPQSPGQHLNPEDRTGGGVAGATHAEFQDSAPVAWSPRSSAGRWKTEATGVPGVQPLDQAWKQTKALPKPLPSRFTGSVNPLNPQPRPAQKDRSLPRQGVTLAGHSSSETPKYGRGRLNYPLPDFSKVGPRVKFPKDESYRPPKSRCHSKQPQGAAQPLIFKSPAEIVREVLLNSGETAGEAPSAHPVARVPQEFQTPEQATKLVHQLQEDYHRLLTKYAAAENTIDQLRLGAKVHLYSDPPQPSHGIGTGMAPRGTKVLSFTIPHLHSAGWWSSPTEDARACEDAGRPSAGGDLSPSSAASLPAPAWLQENRDAATDPPCTEWTEVLATQASRLLAKVESFEGLTQAGRLTPQDQLEGFQRLKAAHRALEQEYLQACREPHLASSQRTPGKFDPTRELEAEIYHLGIRLEELKGHVDQTQREPEPSRSDPALDAAPAVPFPRQPTRLPTPSRQAPAPAAQTPYSEPASECPLYVNVDADAEMSLSGSEAEDRPPGLPAPLRHKELQVEQDFHGLLERYLSVKSLPEALRVEEQEDAHSLAADGPASAPGKTEATEVLQRPYLARAQKNPRTPLQEDEEQMASLKPPGFQTSKAGDRHTPGLGQAKAAGPAMPPHHASHQSSLTSLDGSGISEHLPQKSSHAGPHPEEPWMASPETDSGFVGSETSRVSPFTQTPEHRLAHVSNPGTLDQRFPASIPRDGASHPKARAPLVPRRASEPGTPRSRAQKHLSSPSGAPWQSPGSAPRQRAPDSHLERTLAAEKKVPLGSEFEGRKRISEQLLPSKTFSPPRTPTPAAAPVPRGPPETIPNLPLSRTERDQAIRELQAEVSRLRLRLEDSLHRPPQAGSTRPASAFDRPARTRDRPADSSASWGSHGGSKSTERLSGEPKGAEQAVPTGRQRARASSVPREVPRLSLTSESELPAPQLSSEKNETTRDSPQAAQEGSRAAASRNRRPDRVSFRGQYTGQEYHVLSPKADRRGSSTASCPHCQPARTQDAGGAATRDPLGPSATDVLRCPLCGRAGSPAEGDGPGSATSGAEKATARRHTSATSSPRQRSKRTGSPARQPSGLWYLAAAPPAPAPPPLAYLSPVPVMPYPPATVYYAPSVPTSAPAVPSRAARGHRHSIQLDLGDLEELQAALSQAAQAAESVRSTTRQMSRSLSADLRQAGLRGSCLF